MLALHLVAAVLVFAFPAWDRFEATNLRNASDPRTRSRCYIRSMAVLWLAALAVIALLPFETLWKAPPTMRSLAGSVSPAFLATFLPALLIGLLLPAVLPFLHAGMRRHLLGQLDALDYLLPRTRTEIALFAGVSVSAGICEEVLYCGFLFHYLLAAPWNLTPATTVLLGSVLFGVAHLGQGARGILLTGAVGLVLGGLFIVTGSLLVPIAVHILIDLRATLLAYLRTLPDAGAA